MESEEQSDDEEVEAADKADKGLTEAKKPTPMPSEAS